MTDARAAVGMDRLPWLADEPKPRPKEGARDLVGWGVAAAVLIAGGSYWLGMQTGRSDEFQPVSAPASRQPAATVKLPEPRVEAPQVPVAPAPEVLPAPPPAVSMPEPSEAKPVPRSSAPAVRRKTRSPVAADKKRSGRSAEKRSAARAQAAPAPAPAVSAPVARAQPLTLWPARRTSGAYGRVVRIGAFGTRQQAKLGWRRMQRSYPAVARLPAVVVSDRNSRGRLFYRFQIGTTSQAHSEVLCQRMRTIRYSCAVVGLPWKAKVER